ncbi:hypothetical protein Hanom_Chr05g00422021 [Helianthus anomalus]
MLYNKEDTYIIKKTCILSLSPLPLQPPHFFSLPSYRAPPRHHPFPPVTPLPVATPVYQSSSYTVSRSSGICGATRCSSSPPPATGQSLRRYDETETPTSAADYTVFHFIGYRTIAWNFCLLPIDRIKALVNMRVAGQSIESMRKMLGNDNYICRFLVICSCSILDLMF